MSPAVSPAVERTEAYERVRRDPEARVLVTCEHATQRVPEGYAWPAQDDWLRDTHWAFDLGAEALARGAAEALGAGLVMSRFSRLFIDPNRPEDSPTLFRDTAEGRPVALNSTHLDDAGRARRIEGLLRPYHAAVDAAVAECRAEILLSMHSFTPVYEGEVRALEIGVLFTEDEALAARVADALSARWRTALNEPYSGHDGLMYAVDRHARAHGRRAVELEVRQDLAVDPGFQAELVPVLASVLTG